MPAVVRSGDTNTAGAAVTSSRNVKVNGKSITVNGDPVADHPVLLAYFSVAAALFLLPVFLLRVV